MDKEIFNKLKRIEARLFQVESFTQDISTYVANMEQELNETNERMSSQVNTFIKEIVAKIEDLEKSNELSNKKDS